MRLPLTLMCLGGCSSVAASTVVTGSLSCSRSDRRADCRPGDLLYPPEVNALAIDFDVLGRVQLGSSLDGCHRIALFFPFPRGRGHGVPGTAAAVSNASRARVPALMQARPPLQAVLGQAAPGVRAGKRRLVPRDDAIRPRA